eukprot:TRINITY_DN23699_c0_g1_i1.p1 TRINITY_DN23699_c0_g1~~TRINITY_DN23699_c0_g1_i1.p1  ORF type:complete len:552 (+),score=160.16 TRINITY_DN23699_c0_g1_i1:74-1729(+)
MAPKPGVLPRKPAQELPPPRELFLPRKPAQQLPPPSTFIGDGNEGGAPAGDGGSPGSPRSDDDRAVWPPPQEQRQVEREGIIGISREEALAAAGCMFDRQSARLFSQQISDCAGSLDVFAASSGLTGIEDWAGLSSGVAALRAGVHLRDEVPLEDMTKVIELVLGSNGALWLIGDELAKVEWLLRQRRKSASADVAERRDELLGAAALLLSEHQQLINDAISLADMMQVTEEFAKTQARVEHTQREIRESAVAAIRRIVELPPDEQGDAYEGAEETFTGWCSEAATALAEIEGQRCACDGHVRSQEATATRLITLMDDLGLAGEVLGNPLRRGMPAELAGFIRERRVAEGLGYSSIATRVSAELHSAALGTYTPHVNRRSSADGRLLCLAARQVLGQMAPEHAPDWRQVGAVGSLVHRAFPPPVDPGAPGPSRFCIDGDSDPPERTPEAQWFRQAKGRRRRSLGRPSFFAERAIASGKAEPRPSLVPQPHLAMSASAEQFVLQDEWLADTRTPLKPPSASGGDAASFTPSPSPPLQSQWKGRSVGTSAASR